MEEDRASSKQRKGGWSTLYRGRALVDHKLCNKNILKE